MRLKEVIEEWDPGPPPNFAELFARAPDYSAWEQDFRLAWGPVFYRGRLDGSARLIVVAQDPGPAELIARRGLVGLAGQLVQGFLRRLGLTRSYVMCNAFLYRARRPFAVDLKRTSGSAEIVEWRNELLEKLTAPSVEAIVAVGAAAQHAVDLWPGSSKVLVARLDHPSYEVSRDVLNNWNRARVALEGAVTPDDSAARGDPPYGDGFKPADRAPIPKRDLPFGMPSWFGSNESTTRGAGDEIIWKPTAV